MGVTHLLDSNVLIDLFTGKITVSVEEQLTELMAQRQAGISIITYIEVFSKPGLPKAEEDWLKQWTLFLPGYDIDRFVVNQTIMLRQTYQSVKVPDCIIAATAIQNNLILISKNSKDFSKVQAGLRWIDTSQL